MVKEIQIFVNGRRNQGAPRKVEMLYGVFCFGEIMRVGIAIWNLKAGNIGEKMKKIVNMGFNSISFLGSFFEQENEESVINVIKENNLMVTYHLSFFGVNKDKTIEYLDLRLENILKFIKKGGLQDNIWSICFDPAFNKVKGSKEVKFDFKTTVGALNYTLKKMDKIKVGIENWLINSKIEDLIQIKKAVNNKRRIGMLLDIGHLHISFKKNIVDRDSLADYLRDLPFEIIELHIHDNDGKTDLHFPLGSGNIDYNFFLDSIINSGKFNKNGVVTIEVIPNLKPVSIDNNKMMKEILATKNVLLKKFK